MEVTRETLWKRCLSTIPTKPCLRADVSYFLCCTRKRDVVPFPRACNEGNRRRLHAGKLNLPRKKKKKKNICLSKTAYQHKGTRKKCKKTNQAAIIQWQQQCLMDKPHRKPWPWPWPPALTSPDRSRKQATSLSRVPVHCITPFCWERSFHRPTFIRPAPPLSSLVQRAPRPQSWSNIRQGTLPAGKNESRNHWRWSKRPNLHKILQRWWFGASVLWTGIFYWRTVVFYRRRTA